MKIPIAQESHESIDSLTPEEMKAKDAMLNRLYDCVGDMDEIVVGRVLDAVATIYAARCKTEGKMAGDKEPMKTIALEILTGQRDAAKDGRAVNLLMVAMLGAAVRYIETGDL